MVPVAGEVLAAGVRSPADQRQRDSVPQLRDGQHDPDHRKGFDGATGYFVRADFSLGDFVGQGVCQVPSGAASGCDQGPFAWTPVACP